MDLSAHRGAVSGRLARLGSAVEIVLPVDWLWTVWVDGGGDGGDVGEAVDFVLSRRDGREVRVRWRRSGGADAEHVPEVVETP
jgi:hypothetical protein